MRILDPGFLFHRGILEILDVHFLFLQWDPGDPGSYSLFFFGREILEILDPD